ncbi:MAG: cytochrome c [Nitrospirae bacterium]|nr:cytochrome c [Nitrospirota bacterium]MDE3218142.1 cytochrome c [Nitrospirota bacterium]
MKADGCMVLLYGLIIMASLSFAGEARPGNLKAGQALYQQHCLRCHGAMLDGKGPDGAKLRVSPTDFHKYLSRVKGNLELEVTIRRGRKSTAMHEWDSLLTDQQVSDLIAYIRNAVPHLEVKP